MAIKLPKVELSGPKQFLFVLRKVVSLMWQADRVGFISHVITQLLIGFLLFPQLYLNKLFLDTVTVSAGSESVEPVFRTLLVIILVRLILNLSRDLLMRYNGRVNYLLGLKFYNSLEISTSEKYARLDVITIEEPKFKDRYTKILRTTGNRAFRIVDLVGEFPSLVSGMISALAIFYIIEPRVLPIVILFSIPGFLASSKNSKARYEQENILSPLFRVRNHATGYLSQTNKYFEQRLLQLTDYLVAKISSLQQQILKYRSDLDKQIRTTNYLVGIPRSALFAGLDLYAGIQIIMGRITVGSGFAFVQAVNNFDSNLQGLMKNMVEVYENYLFVSDLVWLLDLPVKDPTHGRKFVSKITKGIVFDHVTFKYPGTDKTIIKDVSFTVNPEENMALIGLNGAGKSTLVKLLCGFYRPDQGRITIDGIEVTAFQQSDYWSKLAVLFQDFESYSFSARENIGLGDARRIGDLQAIRQAAKLVDIDSWIMSLPKGYDTPLSRMYEDSVIPSGGQLQRIAIARTLFKHSSIMILDEPTSSVDPQAEEEIFNQILTIGHKKILMFISHRFSTVRKADRILVLDSGTITESGTHQELMRQKGTYAKLFTLQAKSYQ